MAKWRAVAVAVQGFNPSNFLSHETGRIREIAADGKAIAAVSGGIDSTVAALVAKQALQERLLPVFIDTGFVREQEPLQIRMRLAASPVGLKVKIIRASQRFLDAVSEETDAEEKRKRFRETFYQVLKEEAAKEGSTIVIQGTIAPDWIETQGGIKTQHNILKQVGIDPATRYGFKVVEPLSELYKDQVRVLGRHLGLSADLSDRQPFPGPGLLVRCIGKVIKKKMRSLKAATVIVERKLAPFNYGQYFAAIIENRFVEEGFEPLSDTTAQALGLPPKEVTTEVFCDRVTGVKGDERSYGRLAGVMLRDDAREMYGWLPEKLHVLQSSIVERFRDITRVVVLVREKRNTSPFSIIVRAVTTRDFMTAAVAPVPWKILKDLAGEILKFDYASRVYYDVTPKPPGTIEFE